MMGVIRYGRRMYVRGNHLPRRLGDAYRIGPAWVCSGRHLRRLWPRHVVSRVHFVVVVVVYYLYHCQFAQMGL